MTVSRAKMIEAARPRSMLKSRVDTHVTIHTTWGTQSVKNNDTDPDSTLTISTSHQVNFTASPKWDHVRVLLKHPLQIHKDNR